VSTEKCPHPNLDTVCGPIREPFGYVFDYQPELILGFHFDVGAGTVKPMSVRWNFPECPECQVWAGDHDREVRRLLKELERNAIAFYCAWKRAIGD
jgi:hypothetical protein